MAAILRSAAVKTANRGQPSSFYNKDKTNPVFQSLEQETKKFMGYMRKRNTAGYVKPTEEPSSRPSDTLFDLWNKYEPKLPKDYYQSKLLEMGDFLVSVQEYSLALWQCYDRYLMHFGNLNVEEITDVETFKMTFFPGGFHCDNAGLTFRALMGKSISMYQMVKAGDPKLQNKQSVERCVLILNFLRIVMQVVLPKESLCWLIYNGTVHIYSISRHLMSLGHSARVVEYLLWASMCMETSIPLLAVKYLSWRSTLYTAVCQCYFDCKQSHHAEAFARRGLAKINELSNLESLSSAVETPHTELAFRSATVKMAIMVFKRSAYETRRKPKALLRPKTRANLKEASHLPWPRTPTEKLLADMFEGSGAQFLCILESLNDTNRRILLTSPPASDSEVEILDVYAELFMAAQEILAGGGGHRGASIKPQSSIHLPALAGVVKDRSLMDIATGGEDGTTIDGAIRVVKMAYCFEQWEVFDMMIENVLTYLRIVNDDKYAWDEKALELLLAMEKVNPSRRYKRNMTSVVDDENKDRETNATADLKPESQAGQSTKSFNMNDELIHVAEVLMTIIHGPFSPAKIEVDMIVDAALFLWNKTKSVFQKHQSGSADNPKYLQKMENPSKWVFILDVVHKVLCWCGISSVDPALTAEVVLRLALVFESSAHIDEGHKFGSPRSKFGRYSTKLTTDEESTPTSFRMSYREGVSALRGSKTSLSDMQPEGSQHHLVSRTSMLSSSMLNVNPRTQLLQARDILELGLENVSYARQVVALTDGKSIADVSWAKDINDEVFSLEQKDTTKIDAAPPTVPEEQGSKPDIPPEGVNGPATAIWNTIKDLHLELILIYHRVCIKLAIMGPDPAENIQKPFKRDKFGNMEKTESIEDLSSHQIKDYKDLLASCRKNSLSKALLFMQKALLLSNDGVTSKEQKVLLQDAVEMIQKAQIEERRIYTDNTNVPEETTKVSKLPPPPVLLCRTDSMMVLRPAPYKPDDGQQVAWYRIFARSSSGSNVRVRLNDYYFPGTGEEVPAYRCELRVSGLVPHERYMFAVAAYNADGQIIGGGIGESTKPILASHPLPVLMTWGFLSQIAYQVGNYDIAQQACEVLWGHFIAEPPPPQSVTFVTQSQGDFKLTLMRLNKKVVCQTSPVLLRQFLTSIFIGVDMRVREGQLFCDVVCDKGPLFKGQMSRLNECEKMLVAMELAGWLNEANLALQAVVQCYGLLAPLVFYKIPSVAVVQVLQRCHVVLQEIPAGLRQKRQQSIADSLHHMTACITYSMAKVLRSWGQKQLANNINEAGRRLLALEGEDTKETKKHKEPTDVGDKGALSGGETSGDDKTEASDSAPLHALKKKKTKKTGQTTTKEDAEGPVNEELKALEAHMLSLSKQAQYEHELSGYEDPSILHAYIAYLPSKLAYREVVKFKRRLRYLEFFVQVAQKALTEGLATQVIEWCDDTTQWLARRNEQIIGMRQYLGKQPGVVTVSGDDPKRFAAAMVEYSKEKDMTTPKIPGTKIQPTRSTTNKPKRRRQYKPIMVTPNMSDSARQAQEEAELKAIESFSTFFPDMFRQWHKRKKLRKMTVDEMPWRCQLAILQGLSHFSAFLQRMELRDKIIGSSKMYRTNFLDQEWFAFETAGTLVVGWDGGPSKPMDPNLIVGSGRKRTRIFDEEEDELTNLHHSNTDALDLAHAEPESRPRTTATGIEIAAAMATDHVEMAADLDFPTSNQSASTTVSPDDADVKSECSAAPPPMYFFPPEQEDTPRTYRSDVSNIVPPKPVHHKEMDHVIITSKETVEALTKTFAFFRKSITLSHRGQHWTLLQNSCRALWNCAHTALVRAVSSGDDLLSVDELRGLVWHPMYIAADCVLDMVVHLQADLEKQAEKAKSKNKKLGDLFESWTGDITDEKGGANLKFEPLLDDTSSTDFRWVRRLIQRVLELLYYEQKWEKLVDVAMRFSALTKDRYAEQVLPVLIQAQRQLEARVRALGGEEHPQSHFRLMMQQLDGVVTAKDYLQTQLMLNIDTSRLPTMPAGAAIDPLGHGVYTQKDGQRTVSVPLDIPLSLQTLRQVFDKSQYTSRALQHSRKLLILYLAGQQNGSGDGFLSRQISKVEFVPTTARPQPTMPADISKDEYNNMDDVLTTSMPRSQLGTVISSYEKTIDMLLAKNQKGLSAQAMHELGNLQYHASNIRGAYRWWAEALDYILNTDDALHTWREIFKGSKNISSDMLQRCGLWGCILGGVIASNIAQYILTSDLGLRMECCFLSGYFFKALFRSSLPHPRADRDYALYEVGEGCEVTNLVPGVDLLSEKFRSDGRQVIAALRWVSEELARGRHNLFVLPLLTLNQYFTTFVCRDLQRSVDGRILKVRVLTDLGLFNEAFIVLQRLLHGERLPHTGDSHFRQVESKMSSLKFNTSKPITEPVNLKVLEMVLDKRLSSSLATLYGPHMTCHLSLVQAHLFVTLAETIPVIPHMEEIILGDGQKDMKPFTISTISKGGLGSKGVKLSASSGSGPKRTSVRSSVDTKPDVDDDDETDPSSGHIPKRFTNSKKALTLEMIKGTMLAIADQMVTTIAEVIQENAEHDKHGLEGIPAAELELVVLCKLQQASIASQKQHAPMSARIILSALKLLKSSQLFKPKKEMPPVRRKKFRYVLKREIVETVEERPSSFKSQGNTAKKGAHAEVKLVQPANSQFQYQNFQSRSRLDARLWLDCRLALVKCLMMEVRGLGEIKDPETKVLQELADCRQYCVEGLGEAEACGDVEMQAEFFVQGAILNIIEGKNLENTISLLQDAITCLRKIPKVSIPGEQLLVTAVVLQTDLEAIERQDETFLFTERILDQYLEAQTLVLQQLQNLGEKIEHYYPADQKRHFSSTVSPMRNIYLPQILRLAQIKFRVGHAMSRNAAKYIRGGTDKEPVQLWVDTLGVLMTALQISQASVTREANLEAEILLNLGKVQRMLVYHGKFQARKAAETLVEAIKTSFCNDHDLGLMRQAYLEIALVYLYSTGMITLKDNNSLEFVVDLEQDTSTIRSESNRSKPKSWKSKKSSARSKSSKSDELGETEKEKRAAWLAIRCAANIAQSQRSRMLVIGDTSVTSQKLSDKAQEEIPDFVALDLISAYVLGEKKKVYKNEIEEELAPLIEAQEVKKVESYDEQVNRAKEGAKELGWIHLLGYQSVLQRLCSTSTISVSSSKNNGPQETIGDLGPEFDLGFISHAQCDTTMNYDVVRSMLFSGVWSRRIGKLHTYLASNLQIYSADCCGIYPPQTLILPVVTTPRIDLNITYKLYTQNLTIPADMEESLQPAVLGEPGRAPPPPGSMTEPYKPPDRIITAPSETEVALQFYQPSLEENDPLRVDATGPETRILLLYAIYKKTAQPGIQWITLSQLNDLHDRLAVLAQRAEISLQEKEKPKKEAVTPSPTPSSKSKKVQRIKALSPKVQRDEQLEGLLKQCLEDISALMGVVTEQSESGTSPEIPFEVSRKNIKTLEGLFDQSFGNTLKGTDMVQWLFKLFM